MDLYDYKFKDREIMKIKSQLIRKGNKKIEEFMWIKMIRKSEKLFRYIQQNYPETTQVMYGRHIYVSELFLNHKLLKWAK